jgi:hypothetical protein
MTDLRKAAEMALEALKDTHYRIIDAGLIDQDLLNRNFTVATALRQALAQSEQEPVAWLIQYKDRHEFVWCNKTVPFKEQVLGIEPLYTAPPKREWVGLTRDEVLDIEETTKHPLAFYGAIEAKLKEKNT